MLSSAQLAGNRDFLDDDGRVKTCLLMMSTYQMSLVHLLEPSRKSFLPPTEESLLSKNNAFSPSVYRQHNCF